MVGHRRRRKQCRQRRRRQRRRQHHPRSSNGSGGLGGRGVRSFLDSVFGVKRYSRSMARPITTKDRQFAGSLLKLLRGQ